MKYKTNWQLCLTWVSIDLRTQVFLYYKSQTPWESSIYHSIVKKCEEI